MTDKQARDIIMVTPEWWNEFQLWLVANKLAVKENWNDGFIWIERFKKETKRA